MGGGSWRADSSPTPLAPGPLWPSAGQVGKGRVSGPAARGQCRCDCPGRDESPCTTSRCPSPTPTFSSNVSKNSMRTSATTSDTGNRSNPHKGRPVQSLDRGWQAESGRPHYTTFGSHRGFKPGDPTGPSSGRGDPAVAEHQAKASTRTPHR